MSAGELLDKFSILEIKAERIGDETKRGLVRAEIAALEGVALPLIGVGCPAAREFALLKHVNERIWDMNESAAAEAAAGAGFFDGRRIMLENNARFRVKRRINNMAQSGLHEVKSYGDTCVWVDARGAKKAPAEDVVSFARWRGLYHDRVCVAVDDGELAGACVALAEAGGDSGRLSVVQCPTYDGSRADPGAEWIDLDPSAVPAGVAIAWDCSRMS